MMEHVELAATEYASHQALDRQSSCEGRVGGAERQEVQDLPCHTTRHMKHPPRLHSPTPACLALLSPYKCHPWKGNFKLAAEVTASDFMKCPSPAQASESHNIHLKKNSFPDFYLPFTHSLVPCATGLRCHGTKGIKI